MTYRAGAGRLRHALKVGTTPPALYLPFSTYSSGADLAFAGVTFARSGGGTQYDSTGKLTWAPNNLLLNSGAINGSTTAADTYNGISLISITSDSFSSLYSGGVGSGTNGTFNVSVGQTFIFSAHVKQVTAGATFTVAIVTTGGSTLAPSVSADSSVPFSTSGSRVFFKLTVTTAGTGQITLTANGASKAFLIGGIQLEAVTYQTTPRAYVATTSAAYYAPRFDYDPATLAAKGLLIEEARTNRYLQSDAPGSWALGPNNGATAGSLVADPAGTTKAISIAFTATSSYYYLRMDMGAAVSGQTFATSVYMRAPSGKAQVALRANTTGAADGVAVIINLSTQWQRVSVILTSSGAGNVIDFGLDNRSSVVAGLNDAAGVVEVAFPQVEQNASFATSYIPTTSASVTRAAETASMTGTAFSNWYNQSEGTFVVEATNPARADYGNLVAVSDGTSANRIDLGRLGAASYHDVIAASVTSADYNAVFAIPNSISFKTGFAVKANDFMPSVNGALGTADTSGAMPTVDRLLLGTDTFGRVNNGHIKSLTYYRTRRPNADLQRLTA